MKTQHTSSETSRHTPGPWIVVGKNGLGELGIGTLNNAKPNTTKMLVSVALTQNDSEQMEQEANARLIAAAPELLAHLKDCVAVIQSLAGRYDHTLKQYAPMIKRIDEVIAKAEGR